MRSRCSKIFDARLCRLSDRPFVSTCQYLVLTSNLGVAFADLFSRDDTFDSWPQREPHDYLPDVRYSIIRAINDGINEKGSMFDASIMNTEEDIWDPFVVGDFLLPPFYTN